MTNIEGATVDGTTSDEMARPPRKHAGRLWLTLAAIFTGLFVLNVALRMLFIKLGIVIWRLDDVGEFLLVLVAMAFFVLGALAVEKSA
ncbi:MAG: hypothetical protein M3Y55_06800 [Pseudomonadota bacterium]|nr:hypothetical protein [Pseudomonadota bacterium]